ncbi:MAG: nucleotidyltransferase domain-containing protein [Sphingomonas sp.]|uniref:nucleotidyltransferase domain-containing protein n=1 Tax=Sphingomonas sp. TaxID=28214 RepID=UPI001AD4C6C1|nr:nucleotidyltransferase domain-containing protein [Sphingomonas sp.]MBN8816608.1 nucleotidyltransferase domain-containing protein [Sphingomonas sp.]
MLLERSLPGDFDPAVVAEIDTRLAAVERDERVCVPIAIESGSRAWGFPSPDSDYDCRFVFVRRRDDYASLWTPRDVIETPLDTIFDVNGWDLGKLIKLIVKGNAVAIEWLQSPIRYRFRTDVANRLLALARSVTDPAAVRRHYWSLAKTQWSRVFQDDGSASLKKLFYVLRPIAAMAWLDRHPGEPAAPMVFQLLIEAIDIPDDCRSEIAELLARKLVTNELGTSILPPAIGRYIEAGLVEEPSSETPGPISLEERGKLADRLFLDLVDELAPE